MSEEWVNPLTASRGIPQVSPDLVTSMFQRGCRYSRGEQWNNGKGRPITTNSTSTIREGGVSFAPRVLFVLRGVHSPRGVLA